MPIRVLPGLLAAGLLAAPVLLWRARAAEGRNDVAFLRGPYNQSFFKRHNRDYRVSAALHFSHGKQHDVLLLTPFKDHAQADQKFFEESLQFAENTPKIEPNMEYYAPYTARAMYTLFRAIDWTHMHHEQTYDILADPDIPWAEKKRWTDRAVDYYLHKNDVPRSPAPLDVTMRRAAVMMKPYFTLFRNYYPKSNNFFYGAHWWHPVTYDSLMIAGNNPQAQGESLVAMEKTYYEQILKNPPLRMLLSREVMPRYSRLTPESANIFDNLHMLHGITYDLLSYKGWTIEQKRAELYRVIRAMSYQPGDELLAKKFREPHPDLDPRGYPDWEQGPEGEMSRIMMEMMDEMMPMMMPGIAAEQKQRVMEQFKKKMTPGMQDGEIEGSLHDALMKVYPQMKMMPGGMEPGGVAPGMVAMMLHGWSMKYGMEADIEPLPMDKEPSLPPPSAGTQMSRAVGR